jgi:phosphosulfolactate synthase
VGTNVNLGNIAPNEIIPLETIRLGLRGDTFATFLTDDVKKKYKLGRYYQDDRIRQDD